MSIFRRLEKRAFTEDREERHRKSRTVSDLGSQVDLNGGNFCAVIGSQKHLGEWCRALERKLDGCIRRHGELEAIQGNLS